MTRMRLSSIQEHAPTRGDQDNQNQENPLVRLSVVLALRWCVGHVTGQVVVAVIRGWLGPE